MVSIAQYKSLVKKRKQPEGEIQSKFGQMLNGNLKHRLSPNLIYWTYSSAGEKKPIRTAVLQKRKGVIPGDSDYRFEILRKSECGCGNDYQYTIYLEFKSQKGSLTPGQKTFKEKHSNIKNVICYYPRSVEEGIKILEKEGILLV